MKIESIDLNWLGHAGFQIKDGKSVIYVDPYKISNSASEEKADYIFISHSHYDHCSIQDIEKLIKDGTVVVIPADCQSKVIRFVPKIQIKLMEPGQKIDGGDFLVESVKAYNIDKGFHPADEGWMGYVFDFGNVSVYHSGDSDLIPEMKEINRENLIALLPIGGTYTMNVEEAVKAAEYVKSKITIPMHYGEIVGSEQDAELFMKKCGEVGIKGELLEKK